ncbi:hypothetical protein [uncultured Sphingomonas sp.]|uniref:hypothetical protein n=1 Tax=uncultured Sphingomonas sp. TaxID=158754 RepID=UPI0035CB64F4
MGVLIVIAALFTLFPERYVADVKLAPQDTNTAGLSSILSQLGGNYAALLGNHQPVEIDLAIGRSFDVQKDVARTLGMVDGTGAGSLDRAVRKLNAIADVRALRAGIIEIEVSGHDPDQTLQTAQVYARALQNRLATLSRDQTAFKRTVLNQRMQEATERLSRAENAVNRFRTQNQIIAPEAQLSDAVASLSALRAQYQAVQVELAKARRFNAEQSYQVKSIRAALAAIQRQIADAEDRTRSANGLTASGIAPRAVEFDRLNRELGFSRALYESYTRYLEGAAVEDLTANFNMQILEPAFLKPERQFNPIPLAVLALLVLLAIASEFYWLRPPSGSRLAPA